MPLNRVVLVGRLTRDPEMKYTPQGVPVAQLAIAVNRITKGENGDYEVDFFDIVAWRRTAEYASNYLTKGRLVSIDGRLQTRSWVAPDGTKRKSFEIVADNIDGLDRKGDEAAGIGGSSEMGGEGGSYAPETAAAPRAAAAPANAAPAAPRAAAPARANTRPAAAPADDDLDEADPFADE